MIKIKIHKSKDGQWYSTIHALNNKVVFTSETYRSKAGCQKGICVVANGLLDHEFQIIDTTKK